MLLDILVAVTLGMNVGPTNAGDITNRTTSDADLRMLPSGCVVLFKEGEEVLGKASIEGRASFYSNQFEFSLARSYVLRLTP